MFTLIKTHTPLFKIGDPIKIVALRDEEGNEMPDEHNLLGQTGSIYDISTRIGNLFPYYIILHRTGELCEDKFAESELELIT